ncbi:unnamed protein product [Rhizoctonia solani]|uniref:Uncharacterized protein n=1 Tax=Rhizoctonia solani TaxID=456999 RepID=A0A8H3H2W0_9AGAM|nr:unnamed protein product [Rhizoctonia solani]
MASESGRSTYVQDAHEKGDLKSLAEAYAAMENQETNFWVQKHVRSDESVFILHNQEPGAFGKGVDVHFSWGYSSIMIKGAFNILTLKVSASIGVNVPFLGDKWLGSVAGDLIESAETKLQSDLAKGKVTLSTQSGELWVKLEIESPLHREATIEKDFRIIAF